MRTVEKYQSFAEHLFNDQRVTGYGMMLVKHGIRGCAKKINPTVMYIDAALAVIEACNSYLEYAHECEVTKQLLAENEAIEYELQCELDILKIQHETIRLENENRLDELKRVIERSQINSSNTNERIRTHLNIAKSMHKKLKQERERGVSFDALNNLQLRLDNFIRACLVCLIDSFE